MRWKREKSKVVVGLLPERAYKRVSVNKYSGNLPGVLEWGPRVSGGNIFGSSPEAIPGILQRVWRDVNSFLCNPCTPASSPHRAPLCQSEPPVLLPLDQAALRIQHRASIPDSLLRSCSSLPQQMKSFVAFSHDALSSL